MKSVLFATHENLDKTPVSKAMFYDVALSLSSQDICKFRVFSAGEFTGVDDVNFKFSRSGQGKLDLASVRDAIFSVKTFLKALSGVEVVYFRSYPTMLLFSVISKICRKKIVFDTRGLFFDELVDSGKISNKWLKFLRPLESLLLRIADRVICVTPYQKQHYLDLYSLKEGKLFVIPNGAPKVGVIDAFPDSDKLRFCYVGSLIKWHAPDLVRDFCLELQTRNIEFSLDVITRDKHNAEKYFNMLDSISVYEHNYREQPIRFDYGFCFIKGGVSKDVCYPVKFNEYVASGTKVLSLNNVLVVNDAIEKFNLGICLDSSMEVTGMVDKFLADYTFNESANNRDIPYELSFDFQVDRIKVLLEGLLETSS